MPTLNVATDSKNFVELPIEEGSGRRFIPLDRRVRMGSFLGSVSIKTSGS